MSTVMSHGPDILRGIYIRCALLAIGCVLMLIVTTMAHANDIAIASRIASSLA